jgi:hypothetical protein
VHHDGWTADEILAWEQFSLQMMLKPVIMAMPEDESGFEEECEKPPVLLSGFTQIPRNKFVTLLPLIPNPRNAKERKEAKVRRAFGPPFSTHCLAGAAALPIGHDPAAENYLRRPVIIF